MLDLELKCKAFFHIDLKKKKKYIDLKYHFCVANTLSPSFSTSVNPLELTFGNIYSHWNVCFSDKLTHNACRPP